MKKFGVVLVMISLGFLLGRSDSTEAQSSKLPSRALLL